jgi:hypothetical protein
MRRSVYDRAIAGELSKLKLEEVTPQRLKRLCDEVKEKRGPAVAMHVREVVLLVFRHAQGSGLDVSNPAESIRTSAIATFEPRERALARDPLRYPARPLVTHRYFNVPSYGSVAMLAFAASSNPLVGGTGTT